MRVDQYIADLIRREGGYVDHPADRGGPTMYGITELVARAYGYSGPMQSMPRALAVQIYTERYWIDPKFHLVHDHSAAVAEELLDTGVNMGPMVASRFLQRALNVLNAQGKTYPDIAVDGVIGRMTLAAMQAFLRHRGKDGHVVLLRMLNAQQAVRYMEIAEGRSSQEDFMFGWILHRVGGLS